MVIHILAYKTGARVLSKCGEATTIDEATGFETGATCPACLDRSAWPSHAQQIAAGFTGGPQGGPFDKLAGRPT